MESTWCLMVSCKLWDQAYSNLPITACVLLIAPSQYTIHNTPIKHSNKNFARNMPSNYPALNLFWGVRMQKFYRVYKHLKILFFGQNIPPIYKWKTSL